MGLTVKGAVREGTAPSSLGNLRMRHQARIHHTLHPPSTELLSLRVSVSKCGSQKVGHTNGPYHLTSLFQNINPEDLSDLPKITELMPLRLERQETEKEQLGPTRKQQDDFLLAS